MSKAHCVSSNDEQTRASAPEAHIADKRLTNREQFIAGLKMITIAALFLLAIWLLES
ncbi:hypothetical protein [Desulfoplanes formicivorans]|uniref:Uncharacterized protein n=1 Tax=Desulfoplanes formicivorans TaxID=1592317 RepID=A0A194AKU2_9BACT|nr:hypothetical protein [Desulfoplanes formicivorans]GAU09860.1 hypothetical protein DPF_2596 [Desulfoplanes formicivorans]